MSWDPWSRKNPIDLARYVTPLAKRWLPLEANAFDVERGPEGRSRLVEAIYSALLNRKVRYALEQYHPSRELQIIRSPAEVLAGERQGTCLDLAALFCGVCLGYDLVPVLVVTEGHAFAAVLLTRGLRERDYRPGRALFEEGPLTEAEPLRELIDTDRTFLAVECTGFAHSDVLARGDGGPWPEAQHRVGGVLSFERAVEAGRAQLDCPGRPFHFALDLAVAHYDWRIEPYTVLFDLFQGATPSLASHIRTSQFEGLVEERTRDFVGREHVFRAINGHLADEQFGSGYILIRGEPGIGKTALLAQLVKLHGYVHHFNVATQNIRSTRDFLANVCAQLIVRYDLPHLLLPPGSTQDSGFLSQLLTEAAALPERGPVVVLVDSLDEAEGAPSQTGANRLCLPPNLPAGVFLIVTSRELAELELFVDRRRDIYLEENYPQNAEDVRLYIRSFVAKHPDEMRTRLGEWGVDEAQFTGIIGDKSEGNFMYLVYVLQDILAGALTRETIDDIDNLPKGLQGYYVRHWRVMRAQDRDRFERLYEPVVCQLAVAREPVSVDQLAEWTKLPPLRVRDVIRDWRQFLNEDKGPRGEGIFRIYHTSFQDFLKMEVGLTQYHDVIVRTALAKIPRFLPQ
jgi:hypothetical protein